MAKKSLFLSLLTLLGLFCYSNNNSFSYTNVQTQKENSQEFVSVDNIKTVQLKKTGTNFSIPVLELHSGETIELLFDDLSDSPETYSYSITHCDANWEPSSLFYNDYMDGFETNEVREYYFSSGTILDYIHYRIELPNSDVKIKISGNYLLKVFSTYNPQEVFIQKRFFVTESIVSIDAALRQPPPGEMRYSGQQLNISVNTGNLRVSDPHNEIITTVCQNNLLQGCMHNINPQFIQDRQIDYSQTDALIFEGGNEFRIFEIRNIRYAGIGVQNISFKTGMFHALLKTDKSRRNQKYSSAMDFNGYFAVDMERSEQSNTEADYVWVYFTLTTPMELNEGDNLYLFGELTGWMLSPENQMKYNPKAGAYELRLLLKQGAYNYSYVVGNSEKKSVDFTHFEGSFFDTENVYIILVYYKPMGARYHRIVGIKEVKN